VRQEDAGRSTRLPRLVLRLYLQILATFVATGVVIVVAGVMTFEPPRFLVPYAQVLVEELAGYDDDPGALAAAFTRFEEKLGAEITVYKAGDEPFMSSIDPPMPPLDPEDRERLRREGAFMLAVPPRVAVGIPEEGAAVGYYLVQLPVPLPGARTLLYVMGLILVCVAAASVLTARSLVRPITVLSRAVRAFGDGDLDARVRLSRRDELGELGRAFDEMADRIDSLLREQSEMLANVSHELRTPLARIRVALDIAELENADREGTQLADLANDLAELEHLVNDIMLAARLDIASGRMTRFTTPLRLEETEARSILDAAEARFRKEHPGRRLDVVADDELPAIPADRAMLRRVIDNLLDNAVKYSDASGTVRLRARDSGGGLEVEVADEGRGVDAADVEKVFAPFYRTDPSRSRSTGGVGLGLALAKSIVEAHGGSISMESRKGHGTTVRFHVPGTS
jgi:signal transduction histidine kinase